MLTSLSLDINGQIEFILNPKSPKRIPQRAPRTPTRPQESPKRTPRIAHETRKTLINPDVRNPQRVSQVWTT